MVRGHLRALSTEIEDGIAAFLLDILPEGYKAYVDASVRVGKKRIGRTFLLSMIKIM